MKFLSGFELLWGQVLIGLLLTLAGALLVWANLNLLRTIEANRRMTMLMRNMRRTGYMERPDYKSNSHGMWFVRRNKLPDTRTVRRG